MPFLLQDRMLLSGSNDMHMADALVIPAVAGTMYAASTAAAAYSTVQVRKDDDPRKIPAMGVMGAFVFAAQMINFTIPGTGSSGHLCGGMMLSGVTELPFTVFLAAMQPIHLAIGFVEGLITTAVLCFIYEARPEMLWGVENAAPREAKLSYGKTSTILGILAAVVGGVLSLFGLNISNSLTLVKH